MTEMLRRLCLAVRHPFPLGHPGPDVGMIHPLPFSYLGPGFVIWRLLSLTHLRPPLRDGLIADYS